MGAGATAKLKEIEELRSSLRTKVDELEGRVPPIAKFGRKALIGALGGGAGGGTLWLLGRRRSKKKKAKKAPPTTSVVVNVLPKAAVPVAIGIAAVWVGVRVWEAVQRSNEATSAPARPAVVHPMPEGRQGAG